MKRDTPPLHPPRENFSLQASSSKSCNACRCYFLRAALPRLEPRYDLPLLLLSAVAQPLAALTPYGCGTPLAGAALPISRWYSLISVYRSTHQCGERSNAAFRRQSAANLTSHAPHDSKARLQNGDETHGFMAKPCTLHPIAQRVQLFELQTANVRGQGARPLAFSWGI